MKRIRICVVTPCLNSEKLIEHTIKSVLTNTLVLNGAIDLHYIIQDGNSTDTTVHIAQRVFEEFHSLPNLELTVISESDNSMYDALSKGFKRIASGDIFCYINAGDYYSPYAFEIVLDIFKNGISWVTGLECRYNEKNHLIYARLPFKYRSKLIQKGLYTTILPVIQQESTFWDKKLHQHIDFDNFRKYKYAGDYLLWHTFSEHSELYIVNSWLGGFKIHDNQLSASHRIEYDKEVKKICAKPTLYEYLQANIDKIIWYLPNAIKGKLNKNLLYYSHKKKAYTRIDNL